MSRMTRRGWITAAAAVGVLGVVEGADSPTKKKTTKSTASEPPPEAPAELLPGGFDDDALGTMLEALGLKPKKDQTRYDFQFTSKIEGEEWTFSMSTVLSNDKQTIWLMAWLDELPKSSRDVPRFALLKLLAHNDKLGKGKFFSYIPGNRRFALQQSLENREMTSKRFRGMLVELGQAVASTFEDWSVQGWKAATSGDTVEVQEPTIERASANKASSSGESTPKSNSGKSSSTKVKSSKTTKSDSGM